jgi:hypothetical protein
MRLRWRSSPEERYWLRPIRCRSSGRIQGLMGCASITVSKVLSGQLEESRANELDILLPTQMRRMITARTHLIR